MTLIRFLVGSGRRATLPLRGCRCQPREAWMALVKVISSLSARGKRGAWESRTGLFGRSATGTGGVRSTELRVWTEVWWPLAGSFVSFISFLSWGQCARAARAFLRAGSLWRAGLHYYASVSSSEKWGVGSC